MTSDMEKKCIEHAWKTMPEGYAKQCATCGAWDRASDSLPAPVGGDEANLLTGSFAEFWTNRNSVTVPWNDLPNEERKAMRAWYNGVTRGIAMARDEHAHALAQDSGLLERADDIMSSAIPDSDAFEAWRADYEKRKG